MDVNWCRARQTIVVSLAYYSESSTRPSFRPFPCPILPFPPPGTGVGDLSAEVVERTASEMGCSSSDEKVHCVALVVDGGEKLTRQDAYTWNNMWTMYESTSFAMKTNL